MFISYGCFEEELGNGDQLIDFIQARENDSQSLTHELIEGSHQTTFPLTGVKRVLIKQ